MHRRTFLISMSGFSLAGILAMFKSSGLDKAVKFDETHFLVDQMGQLLISKDGGVSWDVSINLGPLYKILTITRENTQWTLLIEFENHNFRLVSNDGHLWKTIWL